ncbi:MAG: S41 family peptidase [Clostridia bacterium]|nr:S41 family peptidase [Clostridia bacterium]
MLNKKNGCRILIIICLIAVIITLSGCQLVDYLLKYNQPTGANVPTSAIDILETTLAYLTERYVDDLTDEEIMRAAVAGANAIIGYYDDYGYVLSPQQYYELQYPSTAVNVDEYFGFSFHQVAYLGLVVSSVELDSKAYKAGFQPGDIITDIVQSIDPVVHYQYEDDNNTLHDLDVKTTSLSIISSVLNQQECAYFYVTKGARLIDGFYVGGNEILPILLYRGLIENTNNPDNEYQFIEYYIDSDNCNVSIETISFRSLNKFDGSNVGYIHISSFGEVYNGENLVTDTKQEMKKVMDIMRSNNIDQVVIDVKGNPGGSIQQILGVASFLIYDGNKPVGEQYLCAILETRTEYKEYKTVSVYADYFDTSDPLSVVILTDGHSASASEMLVGVLNGYGTGVQVGTTTFGKGIAQTYYPISKPVEIIAPNNATVSSYYAIYYTCAHYYTPTADGGRVCIHGEGFTPLAENTFDEYTDLIDRAIELLGD